MRKRMDGRLPPARSPDAIRQDERPMTEKISEFHAHVYFGPETKDEAVRLCEAPPPVSHASKNRPADSLIELMALSCPVLGLLADAQDDVASIGFHSTRMAVRPAA